MDTKILIGVALAGAVGYYIWKKNQFKCPTSIDCMPGPYSNCSDIGELRKKCPNIIITH